MPKINAQHFRRRANEARIAAQVVRDPDSKRVLLTIAENFEELAKRAQGLDASYPQDGRQ